MSDKSESDSVAAADAAQSLVEVLKVARYWFAAAVVPVRIVREQLLARIDAAIEQGKAATAARASSEFSRGVREGLERAALLEKELHIAIMVLGRTLAMYAPDMVGTESGKNLMRDICGDVDRWRALLSGNARASAAADSSNSSLAAQEGREQQRDAAEPPEDPSISKGPDSPPADPLEKL